MGHEWLEAKFRSSSFPHHTARAHLFVGSNGIQTDQKITLLKGTPKYLVGHAISSLSNVVHIDGKTKRDQCSFDAPISKWT